MTSLATPLELLRSTLAGGSGLRPLDATAYARAHRTYEAHSDQRALLADRLGTLLDDALPGTAPRSVLSIGPGDGSLDAPLAAGLAPGRGRLRWVAAEPDGAVGARCRDRLQRALGHAGEAVLHEGTFDSLADTVGDEPFDVVLAVHSLYYVPDLAEALDAARDRLLPGGVLVLALAPLAELNQLTEAVGPGSHRWWSDQLPAALAAAGLAGTTTRLAGRLDVTDCLDRDSATGREVLDFLVGADCSGLNADTHAVLLDALVAVSSRDGDRLVATHPVDLVVAS